MENKTKKIIGWVLLAAGLLIIFSDLYYSINIFTARTAPPSLFGQAVSLEKSQQSGQESFNLQKVVSEQLSNFIPQIHVSKMLNLISWSVFAAILVMIGGKVSFIGISLLKVKKEKPE